MFHITDDGEVKTCSAKSPETCRYQSVHSDDLNTIQAIADVRNEQQAIVHEIAKGADKFDSLSKLKKIGGIKKEFEKHGLDFNSAKFVRSDNEVDNSQDFRIRISEEKVADVLNSYKRIDFENLEKKEEKQEKVKDYSLYFKNRPEIEKALYAYIDKEIKNGAFIDKNNVYFVSKKKTEESISAVLNKYKEVYPEKDLSTFIKENYMPFERNKVRADKWDKPIPKAKDSDFNAVKERLEYKSAKFFDNLSKDDIEALESYVHNDYEVYNKHLTGTLDYELEEEDMLNIVRIEKLVKKNKLENDMTLYRGTNKDFYTNVKEGDIIKDKMFISTSLDEKQTKKFAEKDGRNKACLFKIKANKGSSGLYIGDNLIEDDNSYEDELLLPKSSELKVTKRYKENGMEVIECELI